MMPLKLSAPTSNDASSFALFALGFRPFYLLASAFAALFVALWALRFAGMLGGLHFASALWHAHEMVFGFTLAVIAGFLLTAGRNWTGIATTSPQTLKLLVTLWIAGRVLMPSPFPAAAAVATCAFPLGVAAALAGPFTRSRNRRNYFFLGLLALFAAADGWTHAGMLGILATSPWTGIAFALDIALLIMTIIAGRVVPMFTNNAVPGANAARLPWLERLVPASVLALVMADAAAAPVTVTVAIAAIAAMSNLARWLLWKPWRTLAAPMLWILHAAYLWIPVHLSLRALALAGLVPPSLATHALTVGAIGGLTLGMMTRTARGHTGRPLVADRFEVTAYCAVLLAAVARVIGPMSAPQAYVVWVLAAAVLWCGAFALFAVRYWPILTRARLDGRAG
jgi:uncharacterized protein involved in response to NO